MIAKNIIKEYKTLLLIILFSVMISLFLIILYLILGNKAIKIESYENEVYKIHYDTTWELKEKTENNILLKYNEKTTLEFNIIELENNYIYMSLEELIDEIEYSIKEENPTYGIIGKQELLITKNGYSGYQLLYEDGENEVMVMVAKKSEQLLIITYQSAYDTFDILLDSVKEIVYDFELLEIEYKINDMIKGIEFETLIFKNNTELKYEGKREYTFASNNYLIELEIPNIFVNNFSLSSNQGYFSSDAGFRLSANVYVRNIYELLEAIENNETTIVSNNENTKKRIFSKINENEYVYYTTYLVEGVPGLTEDYEKEEVYLLYVLRKDRILIIEIENSSNSVITQQLIDSIKVKKTTRYAQNVYRNIENGNLVNEMRYVNKDYTNPGKYSIITLYTPERYQEVDLENDKYNSKYFRYLYNDDIRDYTTSVDYYIGIGIDISVSSAESYDFPNATKKTVSIKKYNNKEFECYYYEYKEYGVNKYAYMLFYELDDGQILSITIDSYKKISENDLKELTNFKVETMTMNN